MLLADCKLFWLSLGWSLCTCKLERHTSPCAAFPWFDKVGLANYRLLSISLGDLMDSWTFRWSLFLGPTRLELFVWVTFQHWSPLMCKAAVWSPALSSCPVTSVSALEEQECCFPCTLLTEGNCPATGGRGVLGTAGSSLTKHDRVAKLIQDQSCKCLGLGINSTHCRLSKKPFFK